MRVCIYGAGSLGTILGAYITRKGESIDLINRNKAHVTALIHRIEDGAFQPGRELLSQFTSGNAE